jgi:hypothetical protein
MSEDLYIIQTEQPVASSMSHRRILWTMAVVAVLGGTASFIFVSWHFGAGVLLGGFLSFINYYWLKVSLKRIFESAVVHGSKPRFLAFRYFGRYLMLGVVLTIVFLTDTIPIIAVIFGLSSFAMAIMVEGFIRLFSTFFKSREL